MLSRLKLALTRGENSRYASLGVLALAIFIFALLFIDTLVNWYADYQLTHKPPTIARITLKPDEAEQIIAVIPSAHLFGQSADDDFMPITSLQMRLTGIVQMPDANLSRAIISQADQPGKIFRIGDELTSGIKIFAINADNVVLEHGGHLEKLPLARPTLQFEDKPQSLWRDQ